MDGLFTREKQLTVDIVFKREYAIEFNSIRV